MNRFRSSGGELAYVDDGEGPDAIREHNRLIAEDERFISTIIPTREGVLAAARIS